MARNNDVNWRCQNYSACTHADHSTLIPLAADTPFRCPECGGEEGIIYKIKKILPVKPLLAGAAGLLLLLGLFKLLQPPPQMVNWFCENYATCYMAKKGGQTAISLPKGEPFFCLKCKGAKGGNIRTPDDTVVVTDIRTAVDKQVLARPKSTLFKNAKGDVKDDRKLKSFERLFVFGSESGLLNVGDTRTAPIGWMKEEDTVDWPHSIVVEYGSPEKRKPVLYFKDAQDLTDIVDAGEQRSEKVLKLYEEVEKATGEGRTLPQDYPIVCMEPGQMSSKLNINPVLESKFVELDGKQARMLRVTAAGEDRGATTFDNPDYIGRRQQNRALANKAGLDALEGIDLDLVFVVDMTGSMQPWVDGLFKAITDLAKSMELNPKVSGRVRLGLWGYQDNPGFSGIQYLTKCFTPTLLNAKDFTGVLDGLKVNKKTPDKYPEDVFSGVNDAIRKTQWRSKNRFVMIIGDAPGHTTKEKGGMADIDALQVRQIANDAGVQMVALAIKDSSNPDYLQYHTTLESQFKTLATNRNRAPAYLSVTEGGQSSFTEMMGRLVGELAEQKTLTQPAAPEARDPALDIAKSLLESAKARLVSEVVDKEGKSVVPRDINGWVLDRDLLNPEITSLEPKLLVTKTELNKLLITTEDLIRKAQAANITGSPFFEAILKAVAGSASNNRTENLKERLPDFIKGLPYKSDFMEKSKETFNGMKQQEQELFIKAMKAKLSYYRTVNENPALWKPLSREAASGDHVAAIPFSQLL